MPKGDELESVSTEICWILDDLAAIRQALRVIGRSLSLEAERRRQVARRGFLLLRLRELTDRVEVLACQP